MADAAPAAKKAPKAKKPAPKPIHPPYNTMIAAALKSLKERSGSSRQAILKYIVANYKVTDEKKAATRLKIALRKGVSDGFLKQVKGTGAAGSFKVAKKDEDKPAKKAAKKTAKKPAAKKAKKPAAKKAKKPAAKKAKKPAAKKAKKPAAKKAKK